MAKKNDLGKLARQWANQMSQNISNNDANRDEVDEEDFKRSMGAKPLGDGKAPKVKPSPFKK